MPTISSESTPDTLIEDIDLGFVPRTATTLATRDIDDQLLLIDEATGMLHVLDAVGSLVWQCLDGEVALAELVDELAEAFGTPVEVVGTDVLALVKDLAGRGLLAGIAHPVHEHAPDPVGPEIGEELLPFRLPDLDGNIVDLADLRGRAVLLVNWSPGCGYCVKIIDDLRELEPALAEAGTDLVLLTAMDVEPNRALFEEHDAHFRTLMRTGAGEDFVDPFPGMGTPVAYLLDDQGRMAAPLARGALEVPALIQRTAGREEPPVAVPSDVKYLPGASEGMCGAGANNKKPRVWTANSAYEIGDFHIGIRTDSAESDELVRRMLTKHYAPTDDQAPANYSLVLGGSKSGPQRDLKLLLDRNTTVIRSRSARRVLLGLASYLSTTVEDDFESMLWTENLAVVHGNDAFLLPGSLRYDIEKQQPRLAKLGMQIVDAPYAVIDPKSAELVVSEPLVTVDLSVLDELPEAAESRAELPRVEPGRYPLRGWSLLRKDEPDQEPNRALVTSLALTSVRADAEKIPAACDVLVGVLDKLTVTTVPLRRADDAAKELLKQLA